MFLSRIFINKVLPITKAVANDDDYPLKFYKAKSKLYRISLVPKRNSMFIRIIAVIDSWFCFRIWFCHILLKWYCNSLLLLSRLTNVTKKLQKRRSESETESVTEIVEKWVDNAWLLWWPERLGYRIRKRSFMSWLKAQWKTQSDYVYCPVVWKVLHYAFHDSLLQNFNWFVQSIKALYKCEFCFGNSAYASKVNINLKLFSDFSRSNHDGTEWKRSRIWEWCYITWYRTRAEFWWWHTER